LVTRQKWRSRHSIPHCRKPHATRKPHGSVIYRSAVMADRTFTFGIRIFDLSCYSDFDLDPMTFIYKNLTRIARDIPDVWKWTSYVKSFESYCITACECVHLVTRGHFRSRDKGGGHTIRSPTTENPMIYANLTALSFIRDQSFTLRGWGFSTFLILWPWFWPDDLHIRFWPVFLEDTPELQMNFLYVKPFNSYRYKHAYITLHTDIQTDRQTRPKLYTTRLREWSKIWSPTMAQNWCRSLGSQPAGDINH